MLRTSLLTGSLVVLGSIPTVAQDAPLQLAVIQNEKADEGRDLRLVVPTDGYLLMLQSVDGYVRVMFPVEPGSSAALGAGEYDLAKLHTRIPYANGRRRGDIVAVWSRTPIRTGEFVRYGHWATSSLSREEFKRDPAAATINLATRLGANGGMAARVEYGTRVEYASIGGASDRVAVQTYVTDRQSYDWKVYQNLARIQHGCPVGTRDVTGSGELEYCSAPAERPRTSYRPTTDAGQADQPYTPPRPLQAPAVRSSPPPPPSPTTRPAAPPPAERRPSRKPL